MQPSVAKRFGVLDLITISTKTEAHKSQKRRIWAHILIVHRHLMLGTRSQSGILQQGSPSAINKTQNLVRIGMH
jgi:hypothetical protein